MAQQPPLALPAGWLQPAWPAPPGVRACFTTRGAGPGDGASRQAAFGYFNLGDHVGDNPAAVAANRRRLQAALQGARPVFMQQVHGTGLLHLQPGTPDGQSADAALARHPGLACTVMVADCLPVLLARRDGRAVAAAHAGWRGLAAGVLERTVAALRATPAAAQDDANAADSRDAAGIDENAHDSANKRRAQESVQHAPSARSSEAPAQAGLLAWLGPCIGPAAFEVGAEVRQAFTAHNPAAAACFAPGAGGKFMADLPALARQRLVAAGVTQVYGNDGGSPWCTVTQAARYYSYRRDGGHSGRMAACIWLQGG